MSKFMIFLDLSDSFKCYITEENTWTSNKKSCRLFSTEVKAQKYLAYICRIPAYITENFDIELCQPKVGVYKNE